MSQIDETMTVDVRAETTGFARDMATMRASLDNVLVAGFDRAGRVLESGLLAAVRRGSLGFDDLKQVALSVVGEIAAAALRAGIGQIAGGAGGGGTAGGIAGLGQILAGALFGLPGRATGGPVSPSRPFIVGERGPELFVPTSAGRIETLQAGSARDVRIAITVNSRGGDAAPQALQRSARQVAQAVRRALADA